ncbi:MAG TPA: hypothetical protein VN495_00345 [Candidatus Paceibacterota bacterium]|nr:hypothetical protein [Candidatus Paceibacterota bacterium]
MLPTTAQVLGYFNLLVGLMLTASILLFCGGFAQYLSRLGTWPTYRDDSVNMMKAGVATLFTLIVLLAIQQFLSTHLLVAVSIVALIVIIAVVWVIAKDLATPAPPPARPPRNGPPPA